MTRCERFEHEGLLQLERRLPLDAHFESCPDCLDARRAHTRLARELAELDSGAEPSPSWTAGVWTRINERRVPNPSRAWARWLVPVGAVAAGALVWVWLGRSPAVLSLTADIYGGQNAVLRGQEAHPGDELRVRATIAAYQQGELRVYFNDTELIATCSARASCARDGDIVMITMVLRTLGTYRPVLIVSNQAIPAPLGNLDQDSGAAIRAGALVQAGDPIPVR